jgi:hypothetical protein
VPIKDAVTQYPTLPYLQWAMNSRP